MSIDQKRLQHLLAIARTGSFGRAATVLGISQPALSTSIVLLEKAAGGLVLTRDRSGAKLTGLGEILVGHARSLELLLGRAVTETKLFLDDVQGPLIIGASPVAAAAVVPEAILRLKNEMPRLAVSMLEGVDDLMIARLTAGEIDMLVSPLGARLPPEIDEEPLLRSAMTVIMRPRNPLARHRNLTFRHLMQAEWVLPIPGNALRRRLEAYFLLAGVPLPAHTIATNSTSGIKALVRQSDRVAIMARAMAEPELASFTLVARPIADERFMQTLGIKRWVHHPISPAAARFAAILGEIAARHPTRGKRVRKAASDKMSLRNPSLKSNDRGISREKR
jgi:LysR family transcriptional regulator, regulator for genes of the gallate degradation pathway